MKLNESAAGVYIISATPFTQTGAIDYTSIDQLVEFYLEHGVTGMTILGMMGEAPKLSSEETVLFIQTMLCLLYTSPSPRDKRQSRMPSSA